MAIEKEIKITADTSDASNELNKVKKSIDSVDDSAKDLNKTSQQTFDALDGATGGAISKFKSFRTSLKGVATGFKTVGGAIAASGIGLLVLIISGVVTAFKASEEGQNKFAKLMGVIGAVTGNVIDLLADFGDFVINLFSGDSGAVKALKDFGNTIYSTIGLPIKTAITIVKTLAKVFSSLWDGEVSKAFDELKNGVSEVGQGFTDATDIIKDATQAVKDFAKQNIDEAKLAAKVADDRAKADKLERTLLIERATLENKIAQLRLKARQENSVSAEERKDALIEAQQLQDMLLKKETEVLQLRADAIAMENTFARSNKENLDAEAQAKANVIRQEAARTNAARQTQRELTRVENEIAADARARAKAIEGERLKKEKEAKKKQDEKDKAEKERLKSLSDYEKELNKQQEDYEAKTDQEKLELERERAQVKLDNLIASEEEKREAQLRINEIYDAKELDLKNKLEEEKTRKEQEEDEKRKANAKALEDAKYAFANNTLGNIQSLLKEGSDLAKGVAAAQATISGIEGTQNAFTSGAKNPITSVFPAFPYVQAGLAAAFNIGKVKQILSTDSMTGGSSSAASSSEGISAPSFNIVEGTGDNQIAQSIQNQNNQPVQAFVVSTSVTNSQSFDRNIQSRARL